MDHFVELNDCQENEVENIENVDPSDGSTVIRKRYFTQNDENEVWYYKVVNGGHDWPGAWGNMDISASEEIWKFFDFISGGLLNDGLGPKEVDSLLLFPNPNGGLKINIRNEFKSKGTISIVDLNGKAVYSEKIGAMCRSKH